MRQKEKMIKKKLDYIICILSVHSVAFIDRINKLFVSALFINSEFSKKKYYLNFILFIKNENIFSDFFLWCEGRGWRNPQQFFYLPFLLDIKKDKYIICPVDLTKGKQENRYVNISTFPSKPWPSDHIWILPLDKASY